MRVLKTSRLLFKVLGRLEWGAPCRKCQKWSKRLFKTDARQIFECEYCGCWEVFAGEEVQLSRKEIKV